MKKGILGVLALLALSPCVLAQASDLKPDPNPRPASAAPPLVVSGTDTGQSSSGGFWEYNPDRENCGLGFWLSADYLLWWVRSGPTSGPLITMGSEKDPIPGALGQPGTTTLFGGTGLNFNALSGVRLQGGVRLLDNLNLEGGYFALQRGSIGYSVTSNAQGFPMLARPFTKQQTGLQDSEATAFPAQYNGTASAAASTHLQGWEVNASSNAWKNDRMKLDLLVGFRALDLNEDLLIQDRLSVIVQSPINFGLLPVDPPSVVRDFDRFQTTNRFYGGQIGARGEWRQGRLSLGLLAKLALGTTQQTSRIDGASTMETPGANTLVLPGGVLALPTNIGTYSRNVFTMVPEGQLNLGYQLCDRVKLNFGYSFLYWNHVARPGSQIDRVANPNQIPTDQNFGQPGTITRPVAGGVRDGDFWAQGLNFGVEFRY